ncbi:SRPBCC family protein [Andreprevotia chitinilytica]|uniref:SRPBCC family protein n=1 Tax=Andreprevotia chitinilytica TaxID=396808 RepID=UPI000555541D|nr:SRPBCC family protein [Andreprevotia chitinilytica]
MYFEHAVVINEPGNPLVTPLSIEQLWNGLVLRAEAPDLFLDHVDEVRILERSAGVLLREMQMGNLMVRDRIKLTPHQSVHHDTEANEQHQGGTLTITIEVPEAEQLLVRFVYNTPVEEHDPQAGEGEANYVAYLKAAYRNMDVEALRKIRSMAEAGELG